MTDHELAIWSLWVAAISAVGSFVALSLYFFKEFIIPSVRRRIIRYRAVDASWCITSKDRYILKYAEQSDRDEHPVMDLVLPSHTSDLFLHILLEARTSFYRSSVEFSFEGDRNAKPILLYWFHPFVARGRQEKHPDLDHIYYDPNHFVDYHLNYHITDQTDIPRGDTVTYGFKINTRDPGKYELKIETAADGIASPAFLTLYVQDPPYSKQVRCTEPKHGQCLVRLFSDRRSHQDTPR
jgi:hypothetical protein